MGKSRRDLAGHRSGRGYEGRGARGINDNRWDRISPEDDPFRDLRAVPDDLQDTASDDYVWPEFEEEDED